MDNQEEEFIKLEPEVIYIQPESPEYIVDRPESVEIEYIFEDEGLASNNDVDEPLTYVVLSSNVFVENLENHIKNETTSEAIIPQENGDNQCILCRKQFSSYNFLFDHFNTCHDLQSLICSVCKLKCRTDSGLIRHYENHKYCCEICNATFSRYQRFLEHKKTHTNSLLYACNKCSKPFSSTFDVSKHIREEHKKDKEVVPDKI